MPTLTASLYECVRRKLAELGYGEDYEWAQSVRPPKTADALACEYTWVVLNSGMKNTVARGIMDRIWPVVSSGGKASTMFRHAGKCGAIENAWDRREQRFSDFLEYNSRSPRDVVDWCGSLPWIGKVTKYHLAKNLGVDCAKPDRWLIRLAEADGKTVDGLCRRLAYETSDRIAAVDVVLWRACAVGVLTITDGVIEAPGLDEK